ncbi:hypothetical protein ACQ1PY_10825 [Ornithobacterium rhinotracheale]
MVRLGELGSLRTSFSIECKAKAEVVNATSIMYPKLIFTPGKNIKKTLASLTSEKL